MKIRIQKCKLNFGDIFVYDLNYKYIHVYDSRPDYSQVMSLYHTLESYSYSCTNFCFKLPYATNYDHFQDVLVSLNVRQIIVNYLERGLNEAKNTYR